MKSLRSSAACAIVLSLAAGSAHAIQTTATLRGAVNDDKGQPVEGALVEFTFKGESRVKIVRTTNTDKKGNWIRVGLQDGDWEIKVTKEGFAPFVHETHVSAGEFTNVDPFVLKPAPVKAAATGGQTTTAPPEIAQASEARMKELGEKYKKAVAALAAGQADVAEPLLKELETAAPEVPEVHYNLGYLYMKRNDAANAETEFRKVIELTPRERPAYIALSMILGGSGRSEDALKLLRGAAESFSQDAAFQFALGATASNSGHDDEAEVAFKKVTELDPANPEPYYYLGTYAIGHNDIATANADLKKYVELAPPDAPNVATAKSLLDALKGRK